MTGTSAAGDAAVSGTATSNTLALQGASKLLEIKGQIIHNRTWGRTFEQWGKLCRQFLSDNTDIRIIGNAGAVEWRNYRKGDLAADFDVQIEAGDKSATVQQARAETLQLLQVLTPYAQEGLVNLEPVLKKTAKLFGFPSPNELIQKPQQQAPAAPAPHLSLTAKLTPEQEMLLAQRSGLGQAGGSWPTPGQPPETQAGQIVPQPLASVVNGNRR